MDLTPTKFGMINFPLLWLSLVCFTVSKYSLSVCFSVSLSHLYFMKKLFMVWHPHFVDMTFLNSKKKSYKLNPDTKKYSSVFLVIPSNRFVYILRNLDPELLASEDALRVLE